MGLFNTIFGKENKITTNNYEGFWNWFLTQEANFYKIVDEGKNIEKKFFDVIAPKLEQLHEGYYFLAGKYDENTAELIITVDGNIKNIVFAEELIACAPKLPNWRFTALKPEIDISKTKIVMSDLDFSEKNIFFYSNDYENYPDEIDLTFVYDGLTENNRQLAENGTYIFLDNYLGELNFATQIDAIKIIGKEEAEKELVPIHKLKDFLKWREKEFLEKYESAKISTDEDSFSIFEANLQNGLPLVAMLNTSLLMWNEKASHPWISILKITFDGENNNGLPNEKDYNKLNNLEDELVKKLLPEE